MTEPDPLDALAIGVAEDHKATKRGGKKAQAAAAEAKAEATEAGSTKEEAEALATVVEEKVEGATDAPVPPAPGEDAETVFDRRLERLERLVEEADFETGSAFGDLRDVVVDLFKHRPKIWSMMSKSEQQDALRTIEAAAKRIITKVVLVVAQEDSDAIEATFLGNFTVKGDAIEAKVKIDSIDGDTLLDAYRLAGHRVMIISADDKRFMSARREVEVMDDQRSLFGGDVKETAAAPTPAQDPKSEPSDDDLADGDAGPSAVEAAQDAATDGDDWGVYDSGGEEWLEALPGTDEMDSWTGNSGSALRMTHEEAAKLADEYGGGAFGPRKLGDDPAAPADEEKMVGDTGHLDN
jgi:hypothetical protein